MSVSLGVVQAPDPPYLRQDPIPSSAQPAAQPKGHSSYSNEQFRVQDAAALPHHAEPQPQSSPAQAGVDHITTSQAAAVQPRYEPQQAYHWHNGGRDAAAYAADSGTSEGQQLLAQAMPGRQADAAGQGSSSTDPFAGLGVHFKEVFLSCAYDIYTVISDTHRKLQVALCLKMTAT